MGSIRRFDLTRIIKEYKTYCFFETGTFWGDGVEYALQSPFLKLFSVELIAEIADKAKARFANKETVEIIQSGSEQALANRIGTINTNCIFWLDAHFPGADAGLNAYDENLNDAFRLPLIKEIETISRLRKSYKDVLIIDDLRIYEDGPYKNGNVPADALPASERNIDFIYRYFKKSHVILKCYLDEGYIVLFPKTKYYVRFILNRLLKGEKQIADFYLVK